MRSGWGNAKFFPLSAVVLGLAGGYALGRTMRHPPPMPVVDTVADDGTPSPERGSPGARRRSTAALDNGGSPSEAEAQAEAKPEAKAEAKPEAKAEAKPEAKAEAKPEAKAGAKPEAKAEAKPEAKAEAKPEGPRSKAHIHSTPEGAQVARASDGEPLGTTPFELELPESETPVVLLFWKKGYAAKEETIRPRGEINLNVDLGAAPKPKKKPQKSLSTTTTIDPFQ